MVTVPLDRIRFSICPVTQHATEDAQDWRPTANWERLRQRARLLAAVREFFAARGFLEVETPILSADVVVDRHLDPFSTVLGDDPARPEQGRRLWLQTSPEFAMKRLLAAGGEAIYQITRAFRNFERGGRHNPEFTMVDWYRVGDDMLAGMRLLSDLQEALLGRGAAELLSYGAAFGQYVGVDAFATTVDELKAAARRAGVEAPESLGEDWDGWLQLLLGALVEPQLGRGRPTILYDYPASQAALAKVRGEKQAVAERFELYVEGIELANGYHELLDPDVLRERDVAANRARAADGKPALPGGRRLLLAMEAGLPPCSGTALGFDRVVMLAAGAKTLDEVLAFPIERA